MKKVILLGISMFCIAFVLGQDFEKLIEKQSSCADISYNSSEHFIKYMENNQLDSVAALLNYWEKRCGTREPIYRAKILWALKQGNFNKDLLSSGSLENLFSYKSRFDIIKNANYYSYDKYESYYGFVPVGQDFDNYTKSLATNLKKNYKEESMEYLLAEFYSDDRDAIFKKIQKKNHDYESSDLVKEYYEKVDFYRNLGEYNTALVTGVWLPTGAMTKIGVHPQLGIQIGSKHKKMNYDLTMVFKFIDSPNEYMARRDKKSKPELTDNFFGVYAGLDVGRNIYAKNRQEIQALAGIGYDSFSALEKDEDKNLKVAATSSYNINLGLGYRYYITDTFYLGLRAKYNIVDYTLNNVIDFTGNPITVQLTFGGLSNVFKHKGLKSLGQEIRR